MTSQEATDQVRQKQPIETLMNEFENGLATTYLAFQRWAGKCLHSVGDTSLTFTDIIILHAVYERSRGTRLNDIAFILNIDDRHIVTYSLRKLEGLGIIKGNRRGKERFYGVTQKGKEMASAYQEIRRTLLIGSVAHLQGSEEDLKNCSEFLRIMSGIYEQAARRAALSL